MAKPSCLMLRRLSPSSARLTAIAGIFAALALVLAVPLQRLQAQVLYGSLVGKIGDTSAADVPGAIVDLEDPSTGTRRQATTSERGEYSFTNIPVGIYDVSVSKPGFKSVIRPHLEVNAGASVRVDATLELGQMSERIEVSENEVVLQTDRAEVKGAVASTQLRDLPVPPSRSYESMLSLIPGVAPAGGAQSLENSPSRAASFNVNGMVGALRSTRIDGAAEINTFLPNVAAYIPSLEAIQEVNATTSSPDAELGGAAGGAINITVKSGTDQFHGSLFEEHSDAALLTNPAILPTGVTKPGYTFNAFGGSLGGPILKDRLFFFVSSDNGLSVNHTSAFYTVPNQTLKNGDLSVSPTPIYDPNTGNPNGTGRTAFAGNVIPSSRFDPIMQRLLALLPLPNTPGAVNNYFKITPRSQTLNTIDAKVNWNPTSKANFFGRMGTVRANGFTGNVFDQQGIGGPIEGGNIWGQTWSTTFAGTYTFSPTLIMDAMYGWTQINSIIQEFDYGKNLGLQYGIPGTNGPTKFESGWPQFVPQTYTVFGMNQQWMPWDRSNPEDNYTANMTWIHGTHQVRFGGEFLRQALNHQEADQEAGGPAYGAQGGFGFPGQLTTLNGGPSSNQYNSMASMLLGVVGTLGKDVLQGIETTRQKVYSLYIRDQWQVTKKFTATLGVRWEYLPLLERDGRGIEIYNFNNNTVSLCGVGGNPVDCGVNQSKHDFGPRVGLAYRVSPGLVVRAGYGLGFDPEPMIRQFIGNYPQLVTFYQQAGANSSSNYTPISTLQQGIPNIPLPSLTSPQIPVGNNVTTVTVGKDFHRGYIQTWNFTIEKQISTTISGQIAYVAARQNGLLTPLDVNAGDVGCGASCQPLNAAFGRNAVTILTLPLGNAHYDALQSHIAKRMGNGYTFAASYTWSKNISSNTGTIAGGQPSPTYALPKYAYLYKGPTADPPFYMNFSFGADLPFGKGKAFLAGNKLASTILGGWKVAGIYSINAGGRFGIGSNSPLNAVNGPTQRADVVAGVPQILGGLGPGNNYLNPAAFVAGPANKIGTAGPGILRGPTAFNLDSSLSRVFRLRESISAEVRADAYNVLNTPHWGNPGGNVSNGPTFAQITSVRNTGRDAGDQRQLQFGVRVRF